MKLARGAALATAVVFMAALATACASGSGGGPPAGDRPAASTIIAYRGADELGGPVVSFDSLLGAGKPVILNFWAAQCPPCRAEMPWFQAAHDRYGDRVLLVGVDIGPSVGLGSNEQAQALLAELGITYPTARVTDDRLARRFGVLGMPTTVFFAADGSSLRSHSGLLTQGQIDAAFADLAQAAP